MAELDIISLYKQDLEEVYGRYSKLYNICIFSVIFNVVLVAIGLVYIIGKPI